ncbi:hypothetical protein NDU88_002331 [Pleurodeles waltl]|uniref:Uncharacterized protein n=1 Tax=Pleurodeles waltl TaxID=8319 RepID=A0AAV7KRU7_PLEWA|nr:hypothetical protein NDU88_002331 [Pleurodeles waltl]
MADQQNLSQQEKEEEYEQNVVHQEEEEAKRKKFRVGGVAIFSLRPEEKKLLRERLDSCFRHTLDEPERAELRQLVYQVQCHQRGLKIKTKRRVGVRSHFIPDKGT